MHATMIMLIDLYERPYSPEAFKSRAFIDRVLALSGPDGGVVGGEDGVSTQRPLKDGGRQAWDMIRRLRQKAWQKAGLDPQLLWTEQEQIEAGIASPAGTPHSLLGQFYPGSSSSSGSPTIRQPAVPDRPLTDFNRMFYNMTRTHILPTPATVATPRPSPLRYSHVPRSTQASRLNPTSQYNTTPAAMTAPASGALAAPAMATSSPDVASSAGSGSGSGAGSPPAPTLAAAAASAVPPVRQHHPNPTASPRMSFMDPFSPNPPPMGVPTPPSMVDPNLNFDWDQWDAVFGQHLPVADELMELDPVSGLEFANFGVPTVNPTNGIGTSDIQAVGPSLADPNLPPAPAWPDNESGGVRLSSTDWARYP